MPRLILDFSAMIGNADMPLNSWSLLDPDRRARAIGTRLRFEWAGSLAHDVAGAQKMRSAAASGLMAGAGGLAWSKRGFEPPMAAYFCYVTAPSRDEALAIGRTVVAERLAASANVIDGAASIYWWQGALEEAAEAVLILKTRAEALERLSARIKELHSYECPCVVALPIALGNPDYLDWIARETAPPAT
jgi:periplasmic divalent cation tolerance protein